MDRWLKDAAKPRVRATTYVNYEGVIRNHIKPAALGVFAAGDFAKAKK